MKALPWDMVLEKTMSKSPVTWETPLFPSTNHFEGAVGILRFTCLTLDSAPMNGAKSSADLALNHGSSSLSWSHCLPLSGPLVFLCKMGEPQN